MGVIGVSGGATQATGFGLKVAVVVVAKLVGVPVGIGEAQPVVGHIPALGGGVGQGIRRPNDTRQGVAIGNRGALGWVGLADHPPSRIVA